jgi:flagellar biogenesis protein FliO
MDLSHLAALLLVFSLLGGAMWLLRRRGPGTFRFACRGVSGGEMRRLELMERISLTPTHSIHLVRAADRLLLLAVSPGSCNCVADLTAERAEVSRRS